MLNRLKNKAYRDAYVRSHIDLGLAQQIASIRDNLGLTQHEFGKLVGKPQSVISRLENPSNERPKLRTLLDIASALDIALIVKFAPFSELINHAEAMSKNEFYVVKFDEDKGFEKPSKVALLNKARLIEGIFDLGKINIDKPLKSHVSDRKLENIKGGVGAFEENSLINQHSQNHRRFLGINNQRVALRYQGTHS